MGYFTRDPNERQTRSQGRSNGGLMFTVLCPVLENDCYERKRDGRGYMNMSWTNERRGHLAGPQCRANGVTRQVRHYSYVLMLSVSLFVSGYESFEKRDGG